jgi:hypothetical protein
MITEEEILVDDIKDEAGKLLQKVQSIPTWTKERRKLHQEAVELLKRQPHKEFTSNKLHFGLKGVGHSINYQVPINKTGYLRDYRGKKVRLVCIAFVHVFRYKILAIPVPS